MSKGLVHFYFGDGKGKTTAAVGLGVRAAGAGMRVILAQFLKNGKSCELCALQRLAPGFELLLGEPVEKFYPFMTPKEQDITARSLNNLFDEAQNKVCSGEYDLVILDELGDAVELGIIEPQRVLDFIKNRPERVEVVITGHSLIKELAGIADYVTKMEKIKHPYDRGISARKGIEL